MGRKLSEEVAELEDELDEARDKIEDLEDDLLKAQTICENCEAVIKLKQ